MLKKLFTKNDRGQVGIGTLIVFIAMVLVAAIAAGVLINTAGFLQTKSEQTGEDSTAQVSNRISVVSAYGNVNPDGDDPQGVDYINLTVMRSAGADNINLSRATVEWVGPQNARTLVHGDTGSSFVMANVTGDEFNSTSLNSDNDMVLSSTEDRLIIHLNAMDIENTTGDNAGTTADLLNEGDQVKLKITTQFGSTTVYYLNVPESLDGKNAVQL